MNITRSNITRLRPCLAAAGAALALSGAALAAPAPPAGGAQFGSVDVQNLLAGYTKKAAYDQQINDLQARLQGNVQQLLLYPMLNKQDQDQLAALLAKSPQTDADKVTISQLQQKSQQAAQELTALQQKQALTDADKTRMADLQAEQTAANQKQIDPDIANTYQAQARQLSDQLSQRLSQDVKAAITAVARERGLAVVFDSQVAIYTANDISDEVLKRLNK